MCPRSGLAMLTLTFTLGFVVPAASSAADAPPQVGDTAADFTLKSVEGKSVKLSELTDAGPVVLVVLRGFPGYQCPVCSQQVGQLIASAEKLKAAGARVVLVYPGPSKGLTTKALEFIKDKTIPDNFVLLVDPDYTFTKAYHLRWDAPQETAYPSTFVIQKNKQITFAKISKTHGGRASTDEVLKALPQ
ncbi:peroxiredoxin family protein [Planctomicrobium piriforme]|uniref:thioredoxin-dependent peroxiredoxin n=1 Tax=Planctomicrobium piriforme TaxID=1576369 RepID=A0A1I3G4Z3_9PLAN|nr:peroxiredoxin family protein [Planctomicrobium piriforme]SFI18536.1 Peroxiredoxin [Planctomicrobium piriforme]